MIRRIPYGIMNYKELVTKNTYFVDKTRYIKKLEAIQNPVFLRPRRFGKSLLCSMLQYYYDLMEADRFEELFGHTWIGQNPTGNQNKFIILKLDFSAVPISEDIARIEHNFNRYCNGCLDEMKNAYPDLMRNMPDIKQDDDASTNLAIWLGHIQKSRLPNVYVIIDEYDNFANQLVTSHQDHLYKMVTKEETFSELSLKCLKEVDRQGLLRISLSPECFR